MCCILVCWLRIGKSEIFITSREKNSQFHFGVTEVASWIYFQITYTTIINESITTRRKSWHKNKRMGNIASSYWDAASSFFSDKYLLECSLCQKKKAYYFDQKKWDNYHTHNLQANTHKVKLEYNTLMCNCAC